MKSVDFDFLAEHRAPCVDPITLTDSLLIFD